MLQFLETKDLKILCVERSLVLEQQLSVGVVESTKRARSIPNTNFRGGFFFHKYALLHGKDELLRIQRITSLVQIRRETWLDLHSKSLLLKQRLTQISRFSCVLEENVHITSLHHTIKLERTKCIQLICTENAFEKLEERLHILKYFISPYLNSTQSIHN